MVCLKYWLFTPNSWGQMQLTIYSEQIADYTFSDGRICSEKVR